MKRELIIMWQLVDKKTKRAPPSLYLTGLYLRLYYNMKLMIRPEDAIPEPHETPDINVAILPVTPGLAAHPTLIERVVSSRTAALILNTYACGTTPETLNPSIKRLVEMGIPVVLLADSRGVNHGPQELEYETQVEAVKAGATPLRDVNINGTEQVAATIREAASRGITGQALAKLLVGEYGTPAAR